MFDEASWTLTVNGERVRIETKPLEILRELLIHAGEVVSKTELLDTIWPNVMVVEASLPTAIHKLRLALHETPDERSIIETVPGIGYRFAAAVQVECPEPPEALTTAVSADQSGKAVTVSSVVASPRRPFGQRLGLVSLAAVLGIAVVASTLGLSQSLRLFPTRSARTFTSREVANVIRRLDVEQAEEMIAAGWKPDAPLDAQGDTALGFAVEICEWDPGHDQRRLILMARTLIDGGATLDRRNNYGDTAYSIAKAKRFCGPDHPVTKMFRRICSSGAFPLGDRCMASYELARGQHFIPAAKPNG